MAPLLKSDAREMIAALQKPKKYRKICVLRNETVSSLYLDKKGKQSLPSSFVSM